MTSPKLSWGGPRSLVLFVLAAVVLLGGGRRWLRTIRSRRLADRLADPDVTPDEILAASEGGREGLFELFRLLAPEVDPARREAAGEVLSVLWKRDQLVAEEEKGVVTRGFVVSWHARRRYPRRMSAPITIAVDFGVPFLGRTAAGVAEQDLEWSYCLQGTQRLSLETFSPWSPGPGRVQFTVAPDDFAGNGPHRLVFQARVRPRGLTSSWEHDLPKASMSFDFDPALQVESIQTLPDDARQDKIARAVRLEMTGEAGAMPYPLNREFALRAMPSIRLAGPLPCDLAHRVELEFEGVADRFPRGAVVVVQGSETVPRSFAIDAAAPLPEGAITRTGASRVRAILTADPGLGWGDADVRSLWPGTIVTAWTDVTIVRL